MKKVLKEKFPEQVRDIYITYPHFESERADNRSRYRELMKYLKKIQRYPGGKEKASEIAKNRQTPFMAWKTEKKNESR